jgi:hypothetical protein
MVVIDVTWWISVALDAMSNQLTSFFANALGNLTRGEDSIRKI